MSKLTETMAPRCFGRYLIDLPADMKLGTTYLTIVNKEVWVEVVPMTKLNHEGRLRYRETELKSGHLDGRPDQPLLKEIVKVDGGGSVFNHARDGGSNVLRTLELHAWRDGYAFKIWVNARDMNYEEEKERNRPDARPTTTPEKQARLLQLFSRLRGRAETEVPTESGLCIAHGFIRGPAVEVEDVSMHFVLSSMPDVRLFVATDSGIGGDTSLLERGQAIKAMIEAAKGYTVRKGSRKANGLTFEEWLIAGNTNERTVDGTHVKGHFFTLEGNSKLGNAKAPVFIVELFNGERESEPDDGIPAHEKIPRPNLTQASFSEAQTVALWDAMSNTLRPRPGGF